MTPRPEIHVRIPPRGPLGELRRELTAAERSGVAGVYLPDSQVIWHDALVVAGLAAGWTQRLRITIAATNLVTRHASVIRSAGSTLHEALGGRFAVALGRGDSSLRLAGLGAGSYEAFLAGCRDLAGEAAGAGPPIYVATNRRSGWAFAARHGLGIMTQIGADDTLAADLERTVANGAEAAGRDPRTIRIACCVYVAADDLDAVAARTLTTLKYLVLAQRDRQLLLRLGLPPPAGLVADRDYGHLERLAPDDPVVPPAALREFADRFFVPADPARADAVVRRLADRGVAEVCLMSLRGGDRPADALRLAGRLARPIDLPEAERTSHAG